MRALFTVCLVLGGAMWGLLAGGCAGGPGGEQLAPASASGFSITPITDAALGDQDYNLRLVQLAVPGAPQELALAVELAGARHVRGVYFELRYDARHLTPLAVTRGPVLAAGGGAPLELNLLDEPGLLHCGQVLAHCGQRAGVDGGGLLATVRFRRQPFSATPRAASQPPDNSASKATLDFNGSNLLEWRYYCHGDCNQDGLVGLTDLTPLGVRYGQTITYPGEVDTAKAAADANGDGVISVADVAPIGMNYGKNLLGGWAVYACYDPVYYPINWNEGNGSATLIGSVPLANFNPITNRNTDRLLYDFIVPAPVPGDIYWVRPIDGNHVEGIASNYAPAGNNSPYAVFTTHAGNGTGLAGIAPHTVYFDASASFDPDGNPITSYAWDFENDGTTDDTTATPLHTFFTAANYDVKLTVSDGTLTGEDLQTIVVGDQGAWHTVTLDALDDAGRYCSLAEIHGRPAVAYRQSGIGGSYLCYTESSSPLGESGTWSAPVNAAVGDVSWISLSEINGQPAIAYYIISAGVPRLGYTHFDGASWITLAPLDDTYDAGNYCNLLVYDTKPRVVYHRRTALSEGLMYMKTAVDVGGTDWSMSPFMLDGPPLIDVGQYASALSRDGAINIAYYCADYQSLLFMHPNNPLLSGWTSRIADQRSGWDCGRYASLAILDGQPCIAYYASSAGPPAQSQVLFTRANDAMGADWPGAFNMVANFWNASDSFSLAVIDGQPALALQMSSSPGLFYERSSTYTSFSAPEMATVDSNPAENSGQYCQLKPIGGRPAIAYYEAVNQDLRFAIRY